jgi:hypothetical protein
MMANAIDTSFSREMLDVGSGNLRPQKANQNEVNENDTSL